MLKLKKAWPTGQASALRGGLSCIESAIHQHIKHPTTDNLIAVADAGRIALNIGFSLCHAFGEKGEAWMELFECATDYVRTGGKLNVVSLHDDLKTVELLVDVHYETQRVVVEVKKLLEKKRGVVSAEREVA